MGVFFLDEKKFGRGCLGLSCLLEFVKRICFFLLFLWCCLLLGVVCVGLESIVVVMRVGCCGGYGVRFLC